MHLGIKNFVGSGVKKYLFGDGQYSQNIVQGGAVLQLQANYTAVLGNIAATGTFGITGTQWNGGAYPATQIFNGVISDWGILDAVVNSSFNWYFGRAVEMQKVRLLLYGGAYNAHDIYADYSDNGVVWNVGNHVGYVSQDGVFHDYALGSAVGAHRYWRLRNASTTIFELSEVQWIEQVQLQNCIVITGAATVAPDAGTLGGVSLAKNIVVDGGSLTLSSPSIGLGLLASEFIGVVNAGRIHVDNLGIGGVTQADILSLAAPALRRSISPLHHNYVQTQNVVANDGGMLFLAAPRIYVSSGCVVSADGTSGNRNGGRVALIYKDSYINSGTVRANGYGTGAAGVVTVYSA